jgi:hypothetical protein
MEKSLYYPVFSRVVRDDGEDAVRRKYVQSARKSTLQLRFFVIDPYSQGLKDARRYVPASTSRHRHRSFHCFDEFSRRRWLAFLYRASNTGREARFTVVA